MINPRTIPIDDALPLWRAFAFGIISSHIMYSIVPPAKDKQMEINILEIIPI